MHIEMRALELLCSKLCHDLISPVSAINNGVELIEDIGESVVDEAMKLIGDSASMATKRLRLFRLAYGRAGSEEGIGIKDVLPVLEAYFGGGKIVLTWSGPTMVDAVAAKRGFLRVLINLLIFSEEILAYGGALTVSSLENGLKVEVAGRSAQLSEAFQVALDGTVAVDDLTPRTIQAYMTGQFAAGFNLSITHVQLEADRLEFSLLVPASDTPDTPSEISP